MKLRIESASNETELNERYHEVIKKYSIRNKWTIELDKQWDNTYITIEVNSLDILPRLEDELSQINTEVEGLIFSTIDENTYRILIYDCCIE